MTDNKSISAKELPPQPQDTHRMTRKIGSTTYEVTINFSKTSKESLYDKILRLIRNDPQNQQTQ
jgi:hypothetical protein